VGDALSSFVAAYNAAASELATNHGTSGGTLTGSSIVFQLEQGLRNLVSPAGGTGAIRSLSDLGITFNGTTGQLTFNRAQFDSATSAHADEVAAFLGSPSGGGFLTQATGVLTSLEDPTAGAIESQVTAVQKQIDDGNQKISDAQTRLIKLNNDLVQQMSDADAAIAALQSQLDFFTAMFDATQNILKNS
jgi:flagellar hook-associated protein 2